MDRRAFAGSRLPLSPCDATCTPHRSGVAHRSLIDWLIDVLIDSPARSNARANRPDALRDPPRQAVKRPDGHPCPRSHRHPMPVARDARA
ncbi:hypothetical protein, partial [Burkholderia pseudomallei]